MKIKILFSVIFILFVSRPSLAQWNFSLSTSQEYSDNPFHYPDEESAYISSYNLGIEREVESFGLGYYGNYSAFSNVQDRNFYWHQFGFWNASDVFMFGLYAEQRLNQTEYEYFDYTNYNLYMKHKTNLNGLNILSQGSITLTNYSTLTDLNNWLASVSTMINKSFETKTTLIGGIVLNYKSYYTTNLDTTQTIGTGRWSSSTTSSNSAYTSQFNYYARVAQSLSSSTGLAIQYTGRNIIAGTAKSVRELEYAYGDESQYFDDPISYEGYTLSAQLTQILPLEILLRASYNFNYKEYPSQGIFIDTEIVDDGIIRLDEQQVINLSATKSISLSENNDNELILSLGYQSILNSSNSYWYDYKSNSIHFGIDFQF